jgi:hypothetical protein
LDFIAFSGCRIKLYKGVLEVLIYVHEGCLVPAPVAVVGRREDRRDVFVVSGGITLGYGSTYIHHQLMSSSDHLEVIVVVELFGDVLTEGVTGTSRVDPPSTPVVGVRPKQVAHWAFVGHLLLPIQVFDVVQGFDRG